MGRKLSVLLIALALVLGCAVMAQAEESELTFELNDDGVSYCVTDCDVSATGHLIIPETYNGKPVTAIGSQAFMGCFRLTEITLPDSITYVGTGTFTGCTGLNYKADEGVKYLGSEKNPYLLAVGVSGGQSHLVLHSDTKIIYDYAFENNYSIKTLALNENLETIGNGAFHNCTVITEITIPDSVKIIGEGAFYSCYRMTKVVIGDGVKTIGDQAFFACSALREVTIGDSVSNIDAYAFKNCTGLKAVLYNGTQSAWDQIAVVDGNEELLNANILVNFKNTNDDYTVTFKNWDGTVLSTQTCKYGEAVTVPEGLTRPDDAENTYTFFGWGKEVTNCMGNEIYTAVFNAVPLVPPTLPTEPSNPTEPSTNPTEPSTNPTEPSTNPTEPTKDEDGGFPTGIIVAVCVIVVATAFVITAKKSKKK